MRVRWIWWPISIQYGWTPVAWWWGTAEWDIAVVEPLQLTVKSKAYWLGPFFLRFGHSHAPVLTAHEMKDVLKQSTDNYHFTLQSLSESFGAQANQLVKMHNGLIEKMSTAADQVNTMAHSVAKKHKLDITDPCLEIVGTLTPPAENFELKQNGPDYSGLLH